MLFFWLFGGPGALILAFVLGLLVGRWHRPFVALAASGVVLVAILFVHSALNTDTSYCHDCNEFFGGAYHPLELVVSFSNAAGWVLGAALGIWVHLRVEGRRAESSLVDMSSYPH